MTAERCREGPGARLQGVELPQAGAVGGRTLDGTVCEGELDDDVVERRPGRVVRDAGESAGRPPGHRRSPGVEAARERRGVSGRVSSSHLVGVGRCRGQAGVDVLRAADGRNANAATEDVVAADSDVVGRG